MHHTTRDFIQRHLDQTLLNQDGYESLPHIYDAAVRPGRWRRALDAVCSAVDARAIALLIRQSDPTIRDLQMLSSAYLKFVRSPWGLYYGLRLSKLQDPDWDFLSRQPAHAPTDDLRLGLPADELDRRADYALLRKRLGIGRRFGVRLNADPVWFDAMSIAFDKSHSTVPPEAMAAMSPLLPHVTKSVELGRTFGELKKRYSAVLTALDRVRVGLSIALPSGEMIVGNEESSRILDLADGLTKGPDGRLRCHDPDQTAELTAAIAAAGQTARGEGATSEILLALKRPSGAAPILVDVAPLRDSGAELDPNLDGALVTVIDPERVPYLRMDRFVALYDLTPAEAEVCGHIVQGRSIAEIAERRDTTPTTAKNQIAAVLAKSGVARRAELIRLVIRVLPPID